MKQKVKNKICRLKKIIIELLLIIFFLFIMIIKSVTVTDIIKDKIVIKINHNDAEILSKIIYNQLIKCHTTLDTKEQDRMLILLNNLHNEINDVNKISRGN